MSTKKKPTKKAAKKKAGKSKRLTAEDYHEREAIAEALASLVTNKPSPKLAPLVEAINDYRFDAIQGALAILKERSEDPHGYLRSDIGWVQRVMRDHCLQWLADNFEEIFGRPPNKRDLRSVFDVLNTQAEPGVRWDLLPITNPAETWKRAGLAHLPRFGEQAEISKRTILRRHQEYLETVREKARKARGK